MNFPYLNVLCEQHELRPGLGYIKIDGRFLVAVNPRCLVVIEYAKAFLCRTVIDWLSDMDGALIVPGQWEAIGRAHKADKPDIQRVDDALEVSWPRSKKSVRVEVIREDGFQFPDWRALVPMVAKPYKMRSGIDPKLLESVRLAMGGSFVSMFSMQHGKFKNPAWMILDAFVGNDAAFGVVMGVNQDEISVDSVTGREQDWLIAIHDLSPKPPSKLAEAEEPSAGGEVHRPEAHESARTERPGIPVDSSMFVKM